jgi:hypothetical protein
MIMGMSQTTNTATATAVGIRCHTALLTLPAIGIQIFSNLWLHEEQLHALKAHKRSTNLLKLARSDTLLPHLMTEPPQPQSAVNSTAQVALLMWFNRCMTVALQNYSCRKPTVANVRLNLNSISTTAVRKTQ